MASVCHYKILFTHLFHLAVSVVLGKNKHDCLRKNVSEIFLVGLNPVVSDINYLKMNCEDVSPNIA